MDMEIFFPGGKKVNTIYKGFTIETDQSKDDGSKGSAPAPFDLFLASIGTCTGMENRGTTTTSNYDDFLFSFEVFQNLLKRFLYLSNHIILSLSIFISR